MKDEKATCGFLRASLNKTVSVAMRWQGFAQTKPQGLPPICVSEQRLADRKSVVPLVATRDG